MSDERAIHVEREDGGRGDALPGHANTLPPDARGAVNQADGASTELRTDMPAELVVRLHPADAEEAPLSDEDIAAFRRRVAEGLYNSREVADEVARRMLRSGDV